jgi:hypothetical protein
MPSQSDVPSVQPYLSFPAEQSLIAPGVFRDVSIFCFVLQADYQVQRNLCQTFLNGPARGQASYSPLGLVLLAFAHFGSVASADPDWGTLSYTDVGFWVPLANAATAPIALFPPFIFVDSPAALITGREAFGLPKQLGRFQMPRSIAEASADERGRFRAEVVGTLTAGGANDWRTIATVDPVAGAARGDPASVTSVIERMIAPGSLPGPGGAAELLSRLAAVPVVGIKQFRDIASPASACYQAIVEAPVSFVETLGQPEIVFDGFDLRLMDLDSHPVAAALGIQPDTQRVPVAFHFQAAMRMDVGTVVWRAS